MNYKAVRGHSKNCRGVIYWFNPPRSLGSHRLSEIDTYPVQTPPRSKRASGRSAAPWTQSSAHWTFSSGPFLDPTFSVRSIKTKTFQRDHLLHNKEATCPVHVGKKHNGENDENCYLPQPPWIIEGKALNIRLQGRQTENQEKCLSSPLQTSRLQTAELAKVAQIHSAPPKTWDV